MQRLSVSEVLDCPALPTLPAVALKLLKLTEDKSVSVDEIAGCVQNDPALTTKILRTVNSSYYGLAQPCPTISRAIAYLGIKTVKSLVLSFSVVELSKQAHEGFELEDFWRRSLYAAAATRRIAERTGTCDAEGAFTAALMQDVGMFAIHAAACSPYRYILLQTARDHGRLATLERSMFGIDHAEVGAALAERWRLPPEMVEAIRYHHDHQQAQYLELVCAVSLGYEVAASAVLADLGAARGRVGELAFQWFAFTGDEVSQLLEDTVADAGELGRLLEVKINGTSETSRIVAQAEEAFIRTQADGGRQPELPPRPADDESAVSMVDALTGVGNRNAFSMQLMRAFEEAAGSGGPFGVVLVDPSRFKWLNESYGREVGDELLVEMAGRLGDARREDDVLCRLGGEQFGLIAARGGVKEVAAVADGVRNAVAERAFHPSGQSESPGPINVSVSVGAAVYDASTRAYFTSPAVMMRAAETALRAAKEAGRNQVRMFKIKPKRTAA